MRDLQTLFTEAVRLHQQNRLIEAEELYRQVLVEIPANVNVLANLGLVCRDLGKLDAAEEYCRRAVAGAPGDSEQHLNLGAVLEARSDFRSAGICYEKALELAPTHPKVLNNYGKLLHQQGFSKKGMELLEQAVRIEPQYPLALNNLGVVYSEQGDLVRAGQCLEQSISLDPDNIKTLFNLAGLYNARNELTKARETLMRLIDIDPSHEAGHHMLAALQGKTTSTAPRHYVEEVFDKYAGRFDHHIQVALGYTAPVILAEMVQKTLPAAQFSAALDLGCGTGLSGEPFRSLTGILVGVDVSAGMLAQAAAKKLYDRLEQDEILSFLCANKEVYQLFIAADVFVYLGDLEIVFPVIAARADKSAILVCSIELVAGMEEYMLLPSGRYAHSSGYLRDSAARSGFFIRDQQVHNIRKENGVWLPGTLYILQKSE